MRASCRSTVSATTTPRNTSTTQPRLRSSFCTRNATPTIEPAPNRAVPTMCLNSSVQRWFARAAYIWLTTAEAHQNGTDATTISHCREQDVGLDRPPDRFDEEREADADQHSHDVGNDQPALDRARSNVRSQPFGRRSRVGGEAEVSSTAFARRRCRLGSGCLARIDAASHVVRRFDDLARRLPPVHCDPFRSVHCAVHHLAYHMIRRGTIVKFVSDSSGFTEGDSVFTDGERVGNLSEREIRLRGRLSLRDS